MWEGGEVYGDEVRGWNGLGGGVSLGGVLSMAESCGAGAAHSGSFREWFLGTKSVWGDVTGETEPLSESKTA